MYIQRSAIPVPKEGLEYFPVVGILGPRQYGKTTLAKTLISAWEGVFLDEDITELATLSDYELRINKIHNTQIVF